MSNKRRAPGRRDPRPAVIAGSPAPDEDQELAELRRTLTELGAPTEVLRLLDEPGGPEAIMQRLIEEGLIASPAEAFTALIDGFRQLLAPRSDHLEAELVGTQFVDMLIASAPHPEDVPALVAALIAEGEASGKPEALAMLRILAVLGPADARAEATEAADRMVAAGLTDRPWVTGLGAPQPGASFGYADVFGAQEAIAITFSYGRKRHAISVLIDHELGGGVKDCFITDEAARVRTEYQKAARQGDMDMYDYDPAEARAILDRALGKPPCPQAPDQIEDVHRYLDLVRQRVALLPAASDSGPVSQRPPASRKTGRTVHRLKITLRGAKPPIWRRLEVPSNATLMQVHHAIQAAFDWEDSHLWVFQTARGDYGLPDPELGHRSAAAKKLDDVARRGDRVRYTYDFGDDWEHDILVEDIVDAEGGIAYPHCLGGRRASPPEDCGGIWGYQELLEVLNDPGHEEHAARLEWLGLDTADEYDPAAFDPDTVNKALSTIAKVLVKP
jgi:hypothetical protein